MKKTKFFIFVFFVCVQLAIPLFTIWEQHNIVKTGTLFLFKTEPIDPTDPFRGKYIRLQYTENLFPVKNTDEWRGITDAYAVIEPDAEGFAKVTAVEKTKPPASLHFVQVEVYLRDYGEYADTPSLRITYPFTRFYMEESKAEPAEQLFSTEKSCYAAVYVKNGKAVLHNVYIDGVPIADLVEKTR